jgi:50S ribosomal subunit-associated GTPase HflX
MVRERFPHSVLSSTVSRSDFHVPSSGIEGLRSALRTSAQALRPIAQIRVPVGDGKLLAELYRDAEVMEQVQTDGVVEVVARVEAKLLGRLRQDGIDVVLGTGDEGKGKG